MLRFMGSQRVGHDAVRSLGSEDPLGEDMATHSSILCLKNSMDRGAWHAAVHGVTKSWRQLRGQEQQQHCYSNFIDEKTEANR